MRKTIDQEFSIPTDWEVSLRALSPKEFYTLYWELYDYQISGGTIPVPSHEQHPILSILVRFLVPEIKHRLCSASRKRTASKGKSTTAQLSPTPPVPAVEDTPSPTPTPTNTQVHTPTPAPTQVHTPTPTPTPIVDTPELNDNILNNFNITALSGGGGNNIYNPPPEFSGIGDSYDTSHPQKRENLTPPPPQEGEQEMPWDIPQDMTLEADDNPPPPPPQEQKTTKKVFGEHKNLTLTAEAHAYLTQSLGIPEAFITFFANRNYVTHYNYPDPTAAIQSWWRRDKYKPQWSHYVAKPTMPTSPCGEKVADSGEQSGGYGCFGGGYGSHSGGYGGKSGGRGYSGDGRGGVSTFDTDDFFAAAVRRTLGG